MPPRRGLFATVPKIGRRANSNEHVIPKGEVQQESNNFKFAMLISLEPRSCPPCQPVPKGDEHGRAHVHGVSGPLLFLVQRCTHHFVHLLLILPTLFCLPTLLYLNNYPSITSISSTCCRSQAVFQTLPRAFLYVTSPFLSIQRTL